MKSSEALDPPDLEGGFRPVFKNAARSVFCISIATVIGPAPPGTGAGALDRFGEGDITGKLRPGPPGRSWPSRETRLMPTSMTIAPGLILPTAATRTFALVTVVA